MKTNHLTGLVALGISLFSVSPAAFAANAIDKAPPKPPIKVSPLINLKLTHVEAVDPTNSTFTVKIDSTNLVVRYTSKTRFFINKMPAVSKDLESADHVSGTLRSMTNGVTEAVRINIVKLAPK